MPRSRGSELPQRVSPRGPSQLRTSTSDSDPLHHRPMTDRSPKLGGNRRSPRGTQSDPASQRKLGTRIADLESQLGHAQEELKSLKHQLASAKAAKNAAQEQIEKKSKKQTNAPDRVAIRGKRSPPNEAHESDKKDSFVTATEVSDKNPQETDVFEVPVENLTEENKVEVGRPIDQDEPEKKAVDLSVESPAIEEPEEPEKPPVDLKNDELNFLKAKLGEKEKELELFRQENESLKTQVTQKFVELSSARVKGEELTTRLDQVQQELETSKNNANEISKKLEAAEKANGELENEMKRLRVQTEQWRKAADAAAAVLANSAEMNGRSLSERCGSMDKQYGNHVFEPAISGYGGYIDSQGFVHDSDDVYLSGKKKSSGIKMFGDLWKKKGQK